GMMYGNLVPKDAVPMQNLGMFGETVVDELMVRRVGRGAGAMAAAVPMAAPAPEAAALEGAPAGAMALQKSAAADRAVELVQPTVRKEFADTAYWAADLKPDAQGIVNVSLKMPENLTTWRIRAWTMGPGTQVGEASSEVRTRKNLIVRLQAPRFFVERDEVVLSANVHNYLAGEKSVQVALELDGPALAALDESTRTVTIPAGGEARVDWRVKAVAEGEAVVRMKALSDEESDAVEQRFPVKVHGMLKTESVAGALRPDDEQARLTINIPAERRPELSRLELRYSPSLAYAMVDALPYLAEYPYGCTEQTLNRFVPAVITANVLRKLGLDLAAIENKRVNLNAQEIGDPAERARRWKHWERNPVFEEATLNDMVAEGVKRLTEMQLSDGGWGWFSGWGESSGPHTTATVVHGLQVAQGNGLALVPGVLENGVEWLKRYQAEQVQMLTNAATKTEPYKTLADEIDALVYMVLADADVADAAMREFIYRDRQHLSVYSKAMFALALHKQQQREQLEMLVRNIEQFVVEDDENQTAWLRLPEGNAWWNWYGSEYESQAYYLKLLAKVDPQGRRASRVAKYLINNRRHGTWWNSTRDTALCIEALAEFIQASGEGRPEMTVELWVDGRQQRAVEITPANLFQFDNVLVLEGDALTTGQHTIEIRKRGRGPLYYNAYTTNFTLEEFITAAGLEVKVQRKLYRLVPEEATATVAGSRGQVVAQRVEKYRREELTSPGQLTSGDLVEVELVIDSKNDYEYVIFEDLKAAGCEPVELLSGYVGHGLGAYQELRDDRASFFVRFLPRGTHSLTYRLRAEVPGQFSALPARAWAMYAPELKGNSDEAKLSIADREEP
ncbi:MAG: alpha-2-macroglobulin, partial [Pirellulales bacterium]|nr:alpha-2-macroglobulin [Pirellulales bacterium]